MRVLVSPDKFKGSLSAAEAAGAIVTGWRRVFPEAEMEVVPLADGGEGTAQIFLEVLGGERVETQAHDALGRPIAAGYVWIPATEMAVIEMSEASGLWRLAEGELDPLRASTAGTGELVAHAIARGAKRILIALGGSATNDAGVGLASVLGWKFLDAAGVEVPAVPAEFLGIRRVMPPVERGGVEIVALCDVSNPLLGELGATRVYGPQKGATPAKVEALERALGHIADLCRDQLGEDFREMPGAGATGGLGFGLRTFCGGQLRPGFETIAELLGLPERLQRADLVITGEGQLDAQSAYGKGPIELARMARREGCAVIAIAGRVEGRPEEFDATLSITNGPMPLAEARRDAVALLEDAAERAGRLIRIGQISQVKAEA